MKETIRRGLEDQDSVEKFARELCESVAGSDPDWLVHSGKPWKIATPLGIVRHYSDDPQPLWTHFIPQAETLIKLPKLPKLPDF